MRTRDVDILIVPGWTNSGPDHWQSRWQRNFKTASRVEQADWEAPDRAGWVGALHAAVAARVRPTVLVGHSLGVATIVHAAERLPRGVLAGAFLVGPADVDAAGDWPLEPGQVLPPGMAGFAPMPMARLPFPSRLIASATDPYCSVARAQALAAAWGSDVSIIADAGHINAASGHGPWPDGLLTFGLFLKSLG